ncbi:MAG: hypothetical protein S4CHLAM37_11510 [Chlamydiia bacterium]|nr:hypothetical protein [Chlamydiia bacterium]
MTICTNYHSLDLNGFHLDNQYFIPIIAKSLDTLDSSYHNTVVLTVDLTLSSSLDFSSLKEQASELREKGVKILFDLKFGFFQKRVKLHLDSFLGAFARALNVFLEDLYKGFEEDTLGVILYRGNADLCMHFPFNQFHFQNLLEYLQDLYETPERLFETKNSPIDTFDKMHYDMFEVSPFTKHLKNLYFHQFFAEYLHRLSSQLPEELLGFAWYDCIRIDNQSFLAEILSKKRYCHLNLLLENHTSPIADISGNAAGEGFGFLEPERNWELEPKSPTIGVVFPNDNNLFQTTHMFFDQVFEELFEHQVSYRLIPEFLVTESWQGLDTLIFMNNSLSLNGKRILQGFSVTGGSLVYLDLPINLENEVSFQEFLSNL